MILEKKVVVVSGVGAGLGKEIAAAALREGARVVLGARRGERLERIAAELDASGDAVAWEATDITDGQQCAALAAKATERFGALDVLVNCAALDSVLGGLEQADWGQWRATLEVNLFGTLQMTQAALPHLRTAGGAIVFISSQSMLRAPEVLQTAYAASKGALQSAMYHLARELGPAGIRVNAVVPSWMWGAPVQYYVEMTATQRGVPAEEVLAELTAGMALGRMATPADVAEAVVFLASDRAGAITGQSLLVNSGEVMR